jgi:hypothetical protein
MTHIDFEAKTERELLVLVAQASNETVDHLARLNNTIAKHESRITKLESSGCGESKSIWRINWQTITLIASLIALIIIDVATRLR